MFYTAAWCTTNEEDFKKALPLEMLGRSMQKFPSDGGFTIVMLEGMDLLSESYILDLERLGFIILDYTTAFRGILETYPSINSYYSRYERNCFLRWIAFMRIRQAAGATGRQFWHLDSDVLLHTSLDHLMAGSRGKTFMTQGCPVFLTVSDFSWFLQYEQQLKALDGDIAGYSRKAFLQKADCLQHDEQLFNQSLYRNPIGSDQDLLEYLISSRQIYQDTTELILKDNFYYIQNALALKIWHSKQSLGEAVFRAEENGQISIGSKLVPFIHYQNTFTRFAGVYLVLKKLKCPENLIRRVLRYRIVDEHFHTPFLFRLIARLNRFWLGRRIRKRVMEELTSGSKDPYLIDLLNLLVKE